MAKMTLGERVNDIRKRKNIGISDIEDAGITKTKYYNFVRGDNDLSMADLEIVLSVLSLSFSELLDNATDEGLVLLEISRLRGDAIELLWAKQDQLYSTYHYEDFPSRKLAVLVVDFMISERETLPKESAAKAVEIYKELLRVQYFTLFEMRIAALIANSLTTAKLFNLYQKFVEAVVAFKEYMPATMVDISLIMHIVALNKLVMQPSQPNRAHIEFIFEAIEYQPTRPSNVELIVLRRFTERLANYLISNSEIVAKQIHLFIDSAERMGTDVIAVDDLGISLRQLGERIRDIGMDVLNCAPSNKRLPTYSELDLKPQPSDFGELIHQTIRSKKVSREVLAGLGFGNKKLTGMYSNPGSLRVSEMLDIMRLTALEPGDVDAMIASNRAQSTHMVGNTTNDLDTAVEEAKAKWEKSQLTGDLENYISLDFFNHTNHSEAWYETDEALALSKQAAELLLGLDSWNESESRLAKIAMMSIDSKESLQQWIRLLRRGSVIAPVYVNTIVDGVEFLIFRNLFLSNQEMVHLAVETAKRAAMNDPRTVQYVAWRWRMNLYRMYDRFLENPLALTRELSTFFVDYEALVGNLAPVRRYQMLFVELWRKFR
jgi:transcriptional regulator with XRE-family HTH domain